MSLKKFAINGIKWTALSSILIALISIIQLSILSHYLSPKDYGLMAIVMVVIGFSKIFSDMGISNAIIHKQNITLEQLSSLYWLNIASGIFIFVIVLFIAPLIAKFYNEPSLTILLSFVAMTFIILSFGNQYKILFQKELEFNIIAKIEILASIASFLVAVFFALLDYGVFALVYATLTSSVVSSTLLIYFGMHKHKPKFLYNHYQIKTFFSFGLFQIGENILNYFSSQFDVILIGKILGTDVLGIYTIAKNLAMRPMQVINPIVTRVTFPLMAKVQIDNNKLKNIYLKSINYLSSINFPIYIMVIILSDHIINILFGNNWQGASDILKVLSLYAMFRSVGNPIGTLQLAKGRADMGFYWDLGVFILLPLSIYIGTNWGILGVSYGMVLVMIAQIFLMWLFMIRKLCDAKFTEYIISFGKPLLLSLLIGIFVFLTTNVIDIDLVQITLVLVLYLFSYWKISNKYNQDFLLMLKGLRK
jgi:O-antigen/teichoic acid export membrane protein